ncbi:MAG: FixH family protein [bacterium]
MSLIRKDRIWPVIVVVVLGSYVTFGLVAARVASHDPNFAIEPDYYRKAVTWDSSLAQGRRSAALGWRLTPTLGAVGGPNAELAFAITDSAGAPLEGAQVSVEARQVAHADDVVRGTLAPREPGVYASRLPLTRSGLWEIRIAATRGREQYAATVRLDASIAGIATVVSERPGDAPADRLAAGAATPVP